MIRDPVIDEQASLEGIDELPPNPPAEKRPWREPVPLEPEEAAGEAEPVGEATGMAGGGMPEAAGQAEDPGTDSDIRMPPPRERINLDRA
jgi:hypothetical protein